LKRNSNINDLDVNELKKLEEIKESGSQKQKLEIPKLDKKFCIKLDKK